MLEEIAIWKSKYVPSGARWIRGLMEVSPLSAPTTMPRDSQGPNGERLTLCSIFALSSWKPGLQSWQTTSLNKW